MKANRLVLTVLLLLGPAVFQLAAQENEADRKSPFDIRVKPTPDFLPTPESYNSPYAAPATYNYNLGIAYANGRGVPKDYVEAVKWVRKAAEQNDVPAQSVLGICYFKGQGVKKDYTEAVKWFRKAAEQNDVRAQNNLGFSEA
jgi:TPR repeat protein